MARGKWRLESGVPSDLDYWNNELKAKSLKELIALGFGNWDGSGLALIPGSLHGKLPKGLEVECIDGETYTVGKDRIDDDTRGGCLAYGIRAKEE